MSWLTKWSFKNKAAMSLVVVMSLVAGVFSYLMLPMEFLPEADNPSVTVTTIGPGYDAKSMETGVTAPIEEAVSLIKGKTDMYSTSGDGFSQVNIMFDSKTDMKQAAADVEKAVNAVALPERVSQPYVVQLNTSMIPISWVTIVFDESLSDAARQELESKVMEELQQIEGAGQVQLSGKTQPSVSVTADPGKLAEFGVPFQALMGVLQGRDLSASIGERTISGASGNVKVVSDVPDAATLAKLPVAPGVTLDQVAKVAVTNEQDAVTRIDGQNALLVTISKGLNANAVAVGKDVEETAARLTKELDGVQVKVLLSTADQVVHSVNSMIREVLLGALFATIVILLFMRNFRATIVTIVSIPLSLGITLYLLHLSGVTLNIITLGGVAVAVGRLVDDSIVVIENIYRRLQKEAFSITLVTDATKEVATAITSSTLTTVAVFLPMGLLRGSLQSFLLPFALTVSYSLLASLLVALTVVPLLSAMFLKNTTLKEHEPSRRFTAFLSWNLNRKWLPLTLASLLFIGSIAGYVLLPKGALDTSSAESLLIKLEYPAETPQEKVAAEGARLEAFLIDQPEREWLAMSLGNSEESAKMGSVGSSTLITYQLSVTKGAEADKLIERIQGQAGEYPGAELTASAMSMMSGGSSSDVYIDVTGGTEEARSEAAARITEKIKNVDGVLKVKTNQEQKKSVYTFEVDPVKAQAADIALQLQGMLNRMPIGTLQTETAAMDVFLEPVVNPKTESELGKLMVMTGEGPAPVQSVAKLVRSEEPSTYYHKNGETYIRVTAAADPEKLSIVGAAITKAVDEVELPAGVKLLSGGASAEQASDFAQLGMTALVSIMIVYLIMVVTFRTLRAPLAILFSLPLAAIGAVLGLMISGVTPDFTAAFGALMLIGVVVTNAIVLIDRVKQNEETMTIREALLEAAGTRMRPILMTAIATICAMLPLVFGTSESGSIVSQSLAIVVIGGLAVATLLTLVIVPVIYELMYFRQSGKQRREQKIERLAA
ncbi:AcrB/AcrD/AcrF family protein [Paenibacillus sambharensis]|uniref:AcrB/AcrD/AcrF family protein n=1 Tax=Paenibacillus sambharensis TaxID=1803190 RepID=A0A2W1L4L7_9BACL|nr:efflux RND transporter permease subunit [Paenibacillus sambharensis]PZD93843.1 AcrB/AcrD/AcrF family protein [Paenibacillus sambharensis]